MRETNREKKRDRETERLRETERGRERETETQRERGNSCQQCFTVFRSRRGQKCIRDTICYLKRYLF